MSKIAKSDPHHFENLFRPAYEVQSAAVYGAASLATLGIMAAVGTPISGWIAGGLAATLLGQSIYDINQALPLVRRQLNLTTNRLHKMPITELRRRNNVVVKRTGAFPVRKPKSERCMYIGEAYEWARSMRIAPIS